MSAEAELNSRSLHPDPRCGRELSVIASPTEFLPTPDKPILKPATLAALIQLASLAVCGGIQMLSSHWLAMSPGAFCWVLLQCVIATSLAYRFYMAVWWRYIHFAFPMAVWMALAWQLPVSIYLWGFVFSLSLYWTTFRTQVPFYPSRAAVWQHVADLLPGNREIQFIDIGSGLGGLALQIAKVRPQSKCSGIEIAPLPWLISAVRSCFRQSGAVFQFGDYRKLHFSDYDVVFAYLSPAVMLELWQKISTEMRDGSYFISYEFAVPEVSPELVIKPADGSSLLYFYIFHRPI